jgi:uncharacterized membrane protein YccC
MQATSGIAPSAGDPLLQRGPLGDARRLESVLRAAAPPLLFGLRLWASVSLALYAAFWLQLDSPYWAGASAAIVCQPQLGASLRKGWFRMIGTLIGATMSVVFVACFPEDRVLFLAGLALWGAACAFATTLLRNFASYAAALSGYTVAIIAGDLLGATGGVDANAAFLLAVTRASEICIGIACAGVVLAGTDFGGARHRLATTFANLGSGIAAGFAGALAIAGPDPSDTQPAPQAFLPRVIALDPLIDQTIGESSQIRHHSWVLQRATDGMLAALAAWYAVIRRLAWMPATERSHEAAAILEIVPQDLRSDADPGMEAGLLADPDGFHRLCLSTAQRMTDLSAATPSVRLLADKAAEVFTGLADSLNGLALIVADPGRTPRDPGWNHLRVPDWLPAFVSAGRAFASIGAVALFWIVTGWPGGSGAITFAVIVVLLLSPHADQAYGAAIIFTAGAVLDLALTAFVNFAALPGLRTDGFAGFCLVMGACLVPIGALLRQARRPWQVGLLTAMTMGFVPILQPTNPETYDTQTFYNVALAIIAGMGAGALSFRLLPPLSPAFRTHRLLALSLRDLRRLARGHPYSDWEGRIISRLSVMPSEATPLQRTQLLAALSVGSEINRLRPLATHLHLGTSLDAALTDVAHGQSAGAVTRLADLDGAVAVRGDAQRENQRLLRARAGILALSEVLTRHAAYFDAGAPS